MPAENLLLEHASKLPDFQLRKAAWAPLIPLALGGLRMLGTWGLRAAIPAMARWFGGRALSAVGTRALAGAGRAAAARALPVAAQAGAQAAKGGLGSWLKDMALQTAGMTALNKGIEAFSGGGERVAAEGPVNFMQQMSQDFQAPHMMPAIPHIPHIPQMHFVRASLNKDQRVAFDLGIKAACDRHDCDKEDCKALFSLLEKQAQSGSASPPELTPEEYLNYLKPKNAPVDAFKEFMWNLSGFGGFGTGSDQGSQWRFNQDRTQARKELKRHGFSDAKIDEMERRYFKQVMPNNSLGYAALLKAQGGDPTAIAKGTDLKPTVEDEMKSLQRETEKAQSEMLRDIMDNWRQQRAEQKKQREYWEMTKTYGREEAQRRVLSGELDKLKADRASLFNDDPGVKAVPDSPEGKVWKSRVANLDKLIRQKHRILLGEKQTPEEIAKEQAQADSANKELRALNVRKGVDSALSLIAQSEDPQIAVENSVDGPGLRKEVSQEVIRRLRESKSPDAEVAARELQGYLKSGPALADSSEQPGSPEQSVMAQTAPEGRPTVPARAARSSAVPGATPDQRAAQTAPRPGKIIAPKEVMDDAKAHGFGQFNPIRSKLETKQTAPGEVVSNVKPEAWAEQLVEPKPEPAAAPALTQAEALGKVIGNKVTARMGGTPTPSTTPATQPTATTQPENSAAQSDFQRLTEPTPNPNPNFWAKDTAGYANAAEVRNMQARSLNALGRLSSDNATTTNPDKYVQPALAAIRGLSTEPIPWGPKQPVPAAPAQAQAPAPLPAAKPATLPPPPPPPTGGHMAGNIGVVGQSVAPKRPKT